MSETLTSELAQHTGISLAGKVGGRALHFLSEVFLARLLGAAGFGLFAIAWNVLRTIGLILPLGLDNGLMNASGQGAENRPRMARMAAGLVFLAGLLGMLLLIASSDLLAAAFQKPQLQPLFIASAFALPFAAVLRLLATALRIERRMAAGILMEEILAPLFLLVLLAGLFVGRAAGPLPAMVAGSLSFALAAGAGIWATQRILKMSFFTPDWLQSGSGIIALLRFSLPTALASVLAVQILLVDRLFVGWLMPAPEVGRYQGMALLALVFPIILSALKVTVAPQVPGLYAAGDTVGLARLARWSVRWSVMVSMPFLLFLLAASAHIPAVVFGPEYVGSGAALVLLAAGQMANAASGPIESFLNFTGGRKDWLALTAVFFALSVGLHLLWIPRLGLAGAALAVLVTFSGLSLAALVRVRQRLGFWPLDRGLVKAIIAGSLTAVWLAALVPVLPLDTWPGLIMLGLASVAGFAVALLLLGLEAEDRQTLAAALQQVRRKG